jgi:hypothetical protein
VAGDVLRLQVAYHGGCREHRFALVAGDCSVVDGTLHVELVLAHDAQGDPCKAIVREQLLFDLGPLRTACRDELAGTGGTAVLHLGEERVVVTLSRPS